jgi:tRNA G46 methylase TrmB
MDDLIREMIKQNTFNLFLKEFQKEIVEKAAGAKSWAGIATEYPNPWFERRQFERRQFEHNQFESSQKDNNE